MATTRDHDERVIAAGKSAIEILTAVWCTSPGDVGPMTRDAALDGIEHLEAVMVAHVALLVLDLAATTGCSREEALRTIALRGA